MELGKPTDEESQQAYRTSVIFAIGYALSKHAHIINMSFGMILYNEDAENELDFGCVSVNAPGSKIPLKKSRYDAIYPGLIWNDIDGLNVGETILVAASGNCESNIGPDSTNGNVTVWPCEMQHPNVVCVGSVGVGTTPAYNFGPDAVDIASQFESGSYYTARSIISDSVHTVANICQGTSVASAHISGTPYIHTILLKFNALAAVNQLYCNAIKTESSLQSYIHGIVSIGDRLITQKIYRRLSRWWPRYC